MAQPPPYNPGYGQQPPPQGESDRTVYCVSRLQLAELTVYVSVVKKQTTRFPHEHTCPCIFCYILQVMVPLPLLRPTLRPPTLLSSHLPNNRQHILWWSPSLLLPLLKQSMLSKCCHSGAVQCPILGYRVLNFGLCICYMSV